MGALRIVLVGCCGWPEARAEYFRHFRAVELQTSFFRPTAKNQENLARFFRSIEREGRLIAWEPRGDWEPTPR